MKKLVAVAGAIAAVVAMVIPAAAPAQFNDAGNPVSGISISAEGSFSYTGGLDCKSAQFQLQQTSATTAVVTKFTIANYATCEITETLKALGCTGLSAVIAEGLNWTTHTDTKELSITGVIIKSVFTGGAFCPKQIIIDGTITAIPDNNSAVSSLTLTGVLTSSLGVNVTVHGFLGITGAAKGTYGI